MRSTVVFILCVLQLTEVVSVVCSLTLTFDLQYCLSNRSKPLHPFLSQKQQYCHFLLLPWNTVFLKAYVIFLHHGTS